MAPTKKNYTIAREKELYARAKSTSDPQELRTITIKLYSRILELIDAVLGGDEERQQLIQERDLLTSTNIRLDRELINKGIDLSQCQEEKERLSNQTKELEATISQLTEWNGSLERQCAVLQDSVIQAQITHNHTIQVLQTEVVSSTRKMIELQQDLDALEEDLFKARRGLKEAHELRDKVLQENAILKSKLHDCYIRGQSSPLTPPRRLGGVERHAQTESIPTRLDTVRLGKNSSLQRLTEIVQNSLRL